MTCKPSDRLGEFVARRHVLRELHPAARLRLVSRATTSQVCVIRHRYALLRSKQEQRTIDIHDERKVAHNSRTATIISTTLFEEWLAEVRIMNETKPVGSSLSVRGHVNEFAFWTRREMTSRFA